MHCSLVTRWNVKSHCQWSNLFQLQQLQMIRPQHFLQFHRSLGVLVGAAVLAYLLLVFERRLALVHHPAELLTPLVKVSAMAHRLAQICCHL